MAANDDVVVLLVFQRLAADWRLSPAQAAAVAGLRVETYRRWLNKRPTRPSQETLDRIKLAIDIHLRARVLYKDVPRWVRTPLAALKTSPLVAMMNDEPSGLQRVHRYLVHLAREAPLVRS